MFCKALQKLPALSLAGRHWWSIEDRPDPGLIAVMSSVLLSLGCAPCTACEGGYSEVGMDSMRWGAWVQPAAWTRRELHGQPRRERCPRDVQPPWALWQQGCCSGKKIGSGERPENLFPSNL